MCIRDRSVRSQEELISVLSRTVYLSLSSKTVFFTHDALQIAVCNSGDYFPVFFFSCSSAVSAWRHAHILRTRYRTVSEYYDQRVCPPTYLKNQFSKLHHIFDACCLWPSLGSLLAALLPLLRMTYVILAQWPVLNKFVQLYIRI